VPAPGTGEVGGRNGTSFTIFDDNGGYNSLPRAG
jgi:hypothetical protein